MGLFPFAAPTPEERNRITACRDSVLRKVNARRGHVPVLTIGDEGDIAFAGSREDPKLLLSVFIQKSGSDSCLGAYVDDEISWYESDFADRDSFEDTVAEYIAQLIGAVIKTVREEKRFSYIKFTTYRKEGDSWSLLEETVADHPLVRIFIWKDSTREQICSYPMVRETGEEEQP